MANNSHSRGSSSSSVSDQSSFNSHRPPTNLRLPSSYFDTQYATSFDPRPSLSPSSETHMTSSPLFYTQNRDTYDQQRYRYPTHASSQASTTSTPAAHYLQEIERLRTENVTLRAQNEILQSNFNALLASTSSHIASSSSAAPSSILSPLVILEESDYPEVKYWQKSLWTEQVKRDSGRSHANRATKNSLLFIVNEDGDAPPQETLDQVRKLCYSLFFDFHREGTLPHVWTQAGHAIQHRFRSTLEAAFPDLRLCHGHWKVDRLASIVFMAWCGTHRAKEQKVKVEEDDSDGGEVEDDRGDMEEGVAAAAKRPASRAHDGQPTAKRVKSNNKMSSTISGKRVRKNPLHNTTPATITTIPSAPVVASSTSSVAPSDTSHVPAVALAPAPDSSLPGPATSL
ncbi:hypothetical protein C8R46DRAFT_1236139 [Mycena filopes]|nr:hypothetical protein C8R46DRAFT_1236139 [Mycena filopes]